MSISGINKQINALHYTHTSHRVDIPDLDAPVKTCSGHDIGIVRLKPHIEYRLYVTLA